MVKPIGLSPEIAAKYPDIVSILEGLSGMNRRRYLDNLWFAIYKAGQPTIVDDLIDLRELEEAFGLAQLAKDVRTPL